MLYAKSTNGFYEPSIHGKRIPDDAVPIDDAQYAALIEGNSKGRNIVADARGLPTLEAVRPPTPEELTRPYDAALTRHFDKVAQAHRYDNRITFAMRAGYVGPWQADAKKYGKWMDSCLSQAQETINAYVAGTCPALPTVDELIGDMPTFSL